MDKSRRSTSVFRTVRFLRSGTLIIACVQFLPAYHGFQAAAVGQTASENDAPPAPPESLRLRSVVVDSPPQSISQTKPPATPRSVLVLRTGGVLWGRVASADGFYYVTTSNGEIRLRARDVEMVGANLDDIYLKKRRAVSGTVASEHIALGEWCLRHGLHEFAARELLDARRLDARHPRLEPVERRLGWTMQRAANGSPAGDAGVQLASHETPDDSVPIRGVSSSQMDEYDVETFTSSIQPLLLNTCTGGGCHQSGGTAAFHLDRHALYRPTDRRTTLRNLNSVIAWIDNQNPDESRLLIEAGRAHGGQISPPLSGRKAILLEKLATWVRRESSRPHTGSAPHDFDAVAAQKSSPEAQESPTRSSNHGARQPQTADALMEFDAPDEGDISLRHGAGMPKSWAPRDAFDPEIFNRAIESERHAAAAAN